MKSVTERSDTGLVPVLNASPSAPIFDAIVWPNRSLSDIFHQTFSIAVLSIAGIGCGIAALQGLWPVVVIGVSEAIALVFMVTFHQRQNLGWERLRVVSGEIVSERATNSTAMPREVRLPLYGLVVERHDDPDFGCRKLYVRGTGHCIELARDLSPRERAEFARALVAAIRDDGGNVREQHVFTMALAGPSPSQQSEPVA